MKKKLIIGLTVALFVGVGAFFLLRTSDKEHEPTTPAQGEKEQAWKPTYSADELDEKIDSLRKQRGGTPGEQALKAAVDPEAIEFLRKDVQYQRQTPEQAIQGARRKLSELEQELQQATDAEVVERLTRHKRLVEKTLRGLEEWQDKGRENLDSEN